MVLARAEIVAEIDMVTRYVSLERIVKEPVLVRGDPLEAKTTIGALSNYEFTGHQDPWVD